MVLKDHGYELISWWRYGMEMYPSLPIICEENPPACLIWVPGLCDDTANFKIAAEFAG